MRPTEVCCCASLLDALGVAEVVWVMCDDDDDDDGDDDGDDDIYIMMQCLFVCHEK